MVPITMTNPTDHAMIRAIAAVALVDRRSVRRELREPGSVTGRAGERIRVALAARGVRPVTPDANPEAHR